VNAVDDIRTIMVSLKIDEQVALLVLLGEEQRQMVAGRPPAKPWWKFW
jgi:hypothetical protein